MRWILALHVICMVAWFAGLFYLPRLFVYHAASNDRISLDRFNTMEKKLYYFIMMPAAVLTTIFGFWLLLLNFPYYSHQWWMHIKLISVLLLWIYHLYCGLVVYNFKHERNRHSEKFYRLFNEVPTVLLIVIIIMVVVKPAL